LSTLRIEVPRAFKPLLTPARYKGAYGGRGAAKSHFFGEQMVLRCHLDPIRAVGIREVQLSIRDSVRQLLIDKITKLGLGGAFSVLDTEIRGLNGSNIIFRGMQSYNADTIKSLEGYDLAWVDEAHMLSQHSLDLLRPTIREERSELWFSWNPRFRTDPVDRFLRRNPPAEAVVVGVNWDDNPWFPDVLRREMEHDRELDAELAEHIWNGTYKIGHGAILARQIERQERAGHIHDGVDYDPDGPAVEISSDIGYRDTASWWFWQRKVGGFSVIDHDYGSGYEADDWVVRLQDRLRERGWPLGHVWLPHDAKAKTFATKHTAVERFLAAFGADKVSIVARSRKYDRINAARRVAAKCEFNSSRCEAGLDGLRAWEFEWNEDTEAFSREPLPNWAGHHGDGYSYGCQVMEGLALPEALPKGQMVETPRGPVFMPEVEARWPTLDEAWAHQPRPSKWRV
jgi:phage terminase large subunit